MFLRPTHALNPFQNEPYQFSHYLIVTRTYKLSAEDEAELSQATEQRPKKTKQPKPMLGNASGAGGVYSFHPEDEVIQKVCLHKSIFVRLTLFSSHPSRTTLLSLVHNQERRTHLG